MDPLTIFIEANTAGLETTLKKGMTTVTSFIDQLNSQEVDWQSILAGSLDSAIIAGIASSFALAIEQAVQFQSSMLNLNSNAAATSAATGNSVNGISDAMVNLAGQTGSSLGDVGTAYEAMFKQIGNASDAQTLTGLVGEIAQESGTNLTTLMPQIITLFNQWGITTLPAATTALQGLVESAATGKFKLSDLIDIISQQGPVLQTSTNVSDLAYQLEGLSNQAGLSTSTISSLFATIAQQGANPLSTFSLLTGVTDKTLTGVNGLVTAFQKLTGFVSSSGTAAQTLGQMAGISTGQVAQLGTQTTAAYKTTGDSIKTAETNAQELTVYLNAHKTDIMAFQDAWATFAANLTKDVGIPILDTLTADLQEINALLSGGSIGTFFKELASDSVGALTSLGTLLIKNFTSVSNPTEQAALASLFSGATPATAPATPPVTTSSSNNQGSSSSPSNINTSNKAITINGGVTVQNTQSGSGNMGGTSPYNSFTGAIASLIHSL
jgi:hypothetical protein